MSTMITAISSKIQNGTKLSNDSYSYAVKSGHWYTYDQYNQLTGDLNYDDATVTYYTYDTNGNITSKLIRDWNIDGNFPMGVLESRTYLYSDANGWGDLLTSWGGQTFTYDAIGNPLTYRDGISMTWKNGRELKSVSKDGKTINFTYDLSGMRTNKTINVVQNGTLSATNVKYIYESGKLLQMRYGSRVLDFTYDSGGTPISLIYRSSETANPTYYYYGVNARGDVEALYTSSGAVSAKYNYDAYGKLLSVKTASGIDITNETSIAILNPLRYRGYVYDTETGFYYLQSRYYDPTTCRFVNADGYVSTGQGMNGNNMFSYCNNNPVNCSDSSGQFWGFVVGGILVVGLAFALSGCSSEPEPTHLPYKTADEAAMAFANSTYSSSQYIRHEYGTVIYSTTTNGATTYDYAPPVAGEPHSVGYGEVQVPSGTTKVATAHTHPNSNYFSGITPGATSGDIPNAIKRGMDSYVVGPNLKLQKYSISSNSISIVGVTSPVALTNQQKAALVSQFQVSWDSHFGTCNFGCENMDWPTP